jgi:S1-C subfamily serine protease
MNASVKLLHTVLPSTVGLRVDVAASHPSSQILGTQRVGSGTIIGSDLLLTVNYLTVGAERIEVFFLDNKHGPGEVVAHDYYSGLAVVRFVGDAYPVAAFRSSETLTIGQEVFIVASAGESQRRVNTGSITSLSSFDAFWEYRLERAITTTILNPGLGGGGLFDMRGDLCGVVSLDLNQIGHFTLAVPVEHFTDHRAELLRYGRLVTRRARAWLGVYCYTIDDHVLVAGVLPNSPAQRAGLAAGDVILAVDGEEVSNRGDLYQRIWCRAPGEIVQLQVYNDKVVRDVAVEGGNAEEFFS